MTAAPQTTLDYQEITQQIYRYCRAMDRTDRKLGYSIWHEDGTADYGESVFQGMARDFIDHAFRHHREFLARSHQVTNILIQVNGRFAGSESYVTANHRLVRDGRITQMTTLSRYIDRWSFRDNRWALDHRLAVTDMDEIRDVTPMKEHHQGTNGGNDPSYAVLKG